ncbi:YdcF family protein [filamentous cyanobacterium LEGE 11480]|uniref:YdcF family protein n=1 Tax=Romeriopsis navalis LEGE 11480 TaxID=2777977 RepID=A0A928Z563_9CYAN|nr:YdcF family protein [Romeriopsis navalis]MBE9032479.1 YdcF family protein [Romeriopsis navalis LEGE 11480]
MLLVTDVFLLLTQVLLWILVALAARFILLQALPKAFLGSLVLVLLVVVTALTFFSGTPQAGVLGEIWNLISVIFNPLAVILILLGIVWRDADKKGLTNTSKWFLRVGVIALLLMSMPLVSNFLLQRTESEALQIARAESVALPAGARRVIVLMGQDTTRLQVRPRIEDAPEPPKPRKAGSGILKPAPPLKESTYTMLTQQAQLTEHGDRILYAAKLFEQEGGSAPLIVVTAGQYPGRPRKSGETRESASAARDISRILQTQLGIPGDRILEDSNSSTVQASAANVRKLLDKQEINYGAQLMLVTSALEASRTNLTFQNEFASNGQPIAVLSRPTDFYMLPAKEALSARAKGADVIERRLALRDFLPSVDSLEMSTRLFNETLTSMYYFLRGWVRPIRPQ